MLNRMLKDTAVKVKLGLLYWVCEKFAYDNDVTVSISYYPRSMGYWRAEDGGYDTTRLFNTGKGSKRKAYLEGRCKIPSNW